MQNRGKNNEIELCILFAYSSIDHNLDIGTILLASLHHLFGQGTA